MEEIAQQIQDFFNTDSKAEEPKDVIETRFSNERLEWTNKIKSMSEKMKDIVQLSELMVTIYTERQRAVEYYHYLISMFKKVNRKYTREWTAKYQYYSYKAQVRFPNERTKELQILSEMENIVRIREELDNQSKFISQSINTIDNLIYGIKYKIEVEKMKNGIFN